MEWDKKAVYYGDKAKLKIKTFELSDEKSMIKLYLYDEFFKDECFCFFEKKIRINKDEIEQEIEFNFSLEKLNLTENDLELFVGVKLTDCNGKVLNTKTPTIRVGIGFIYE